jgi:hypothetical protein
VILPPAPTGENCVPRLFAKFVAPLVVGGPGVCFVDFGVPSAGADGAPIPENAYQKHKALTMIRTTKVNVRFKRTALPRCSRRSAKPQPQPLKFRLSHEPNFADCRAIDGALNYGAINL